MNHYTLTGVDPGLVHSGVVTLDLNLQAREWSVSHTAIASILDTDANVDVQATAMAIVQAEQALTRGLGSDQEYCWIEQYRDRGTSFQQHGPMRALEHELKRRMLGAKLQDNTGVKRIVTREMLQLFDMWNFPTTNHRDLQAAARILLYGAIKNDVLNGVLYRFTVDHLDGEPWVKL